MDAIKTSKTHKLYLLLKERIRSGALGPGARLLSEQQLALTHQMSRVTVRRALQGLQREGLVVRQPGSGTYVRDLPPSQATVSGDLTNMLASLIAMGKSTDVRLLSFSYVTPPSVVAEMLKLEANERVQHSLRVRLMDGEPFSYLSAYVPERIGRKFTEADLAERPLLELLEYSGVFAARAEQTISATLAGPDAAAALGVELGAPLTALTRIVLDRDGRGVEYLAALYRPDRHQFNMQMTRAGEQGNRRWYSAEPAPPHVAPRRPNIRAAERARRVGPQ